MNKTVFYSPGIALLYLRTLAFNVLHFNPTKFQNAQFSANQIQPGYFNHALILMPDFPVVVSSAQYFVKLNGWNMELYKIFVK